VAGNIATVPRLLGWDKQRIHARVDELLDLVSLEREVRGRYPLMDEPFGAIDPINRERLQNEFLRLQRELRKTIVFVTHDIDEALKMGDRIAVMKVGGVLAQYATPAELLASPADHFVEDFVGGDRALKRLGLQRVRDIDLWTAALVRAGEPAAEARARIEEADLPYALLVDEDRRPLGWLSDKALEGERVEPHLRSGPEPVVELDDVLRDALSDLLQSEAQYGPVVDAERRVAGVLSIEVIGHALQAPPEAVPHGADAPIA
jgi:osmoprotectant transport system ATP-binding protein